MLDQLEIPTFTYGTYSALDGTEVKFTDELMAQLADNTNDLIAKKVLTPPVGYDEIDEHGKYKHRGTEAHAHVTGVTFKNGVVKLALGKPSETFRKDVKDGRRLRVSGEFHPNFKYNDASGAEITVGPTIVGLAALGRHRPALKNPSLVPLSDLPFSESVPDAVAKAAREELKRGGYLSHTLADGRFAFAEIEVKAFGEEHAVDDVVVITTNRNGNRGRKGKIAAIRTGTFFAVDTGEDYPGIIRWLASDELVADDGAVQFREEESEMTMTPELQKAITDAVAAATAPLVDKNKELEGQLKQFSENAKRETAALQFREKFEKDRKAAGAALPVLLLDGLQTMLSNPTYTDAQLTEIKAFAQMIPGAFVGGGRAGERPGDESQQPAGEEPKALAAVRPKHFNDIDANAQILGEALFAFAEFQPSLVADKDGKAKSPDQQMQAMKTYIMKRDVAA